MSTSQNNPDPDNFSGNEIQFDLTKFTIVPSICPVTYTCTNVVEGDGGTISSVECDDFSFDGVFDGDATDGVLTFTASENDYITGNYRPGIYEVTITGTADGSNPLVSTTTTFTIELLDPCDPPESRGFASTFVD